MTLIKYFKTINTVMYTHTLMFAICWFFYHAEMKTFFIKALEVKNFFIPSRIIYEIRLLNVRRLAVNARF